MALRTDPELLVLALQIRNETDVEENTAIRVGDMFADLVASKINQDVSVYPQYAGFTVGSYIPIWNDSLQEVQHIPAEDLLGTADVSIYEWENDEDYIIDEVRTHLGKWYQALAANGPGTTIVEPGTNPAVWDELNKPRVGIIPWEAGVYVEDEVFVMAEDAGEWGMYRLIDPARPYVSSNFATELAALDWDLVSGESIAINRAFTQTLIFDKKEISFAVHTMTSDLIYQLGGGNLVNSFSGARQRIVADGIHAINFGLGFDFVYGISNGQILEAGTYELYFLYLNGSVTVSLPGTTAESSNGVQLTAPTSFAAIADGENDIDLSWDNISGNEGYLVEFSLNGTSGWTTLETTAQDATTSTQSGLAPSDTRYYRIKTLGDGLTTFDSSYSGIVSAQTESSGDTTDPTFTWLPTAGSSIWPVNKPIVITADEPIRNADGSEITNANVATRITLKESNSGGTNIPFTATIDGTKTVITVTPTTQYGDNQLVYVAINNVEDVNGNDITSAVSITFTTSSFTYMNGTSNRLQFGDILDSLFAANDTNFWLEITLNNPLLSGARGLVAKSGGDGTGASNSFHWFYIGTDVYFTYQMTSTSQRTIKWTDVLTAGEHDLILKYDGSIDTNNGLDRVILLIDGATAGSKTMNSTVGSLSGSINNSSAYLAVGGFVNSSGNAANANFYTEEMKDFVVRSTAGSVVQINVPLLYEGTDTSGNARNGTWV